jgi:Uncharacterised nucleotidyltransferase
MKHSIIECLLDDTVPLPNDTHEYEAFLKNNDFLSVGATVYSILKRQNRLQQSPDFFRESLKHIHTDIFNKNLFIKSETQQILNAFEKQGIEVIPLKGPFFAEKYFGDLGARVSSDIDLLIKKKDVLRATACIKKLGFLSEKEEVVSHFHCGFYKNLPHSPCPLAVELHWDLVKKNTSNMDIEAFWKEAIPYQASYHYVRELSDFHAFYMICLHSWRHNLDSLKYFMDIMQMIKVLSLSLDFTRLIEEATKHQTRKRLIRTLSIVYDQYPFMAAIKSFPYQKHKTIYQTSQKSSIKQYFTFLDYQFMSYDSIAHRFAELRKWIFPSQQEMSYLINTKKRSYILLSYFHLYKKRFSNLWKALW